MAESTGDFLLDELRSILATIEGLTLERTWSEEASNHSYPYAFVGIGFERRATETEGGEGETWVRNWGGELNVRLEGGDTQNTGAIRELSELWWDRLWSAIATASGGERTASLTAHKVRITSIDLEDFIPAWAFRESVGKATFNGTITYERGPLS